MDITVPRYQDCMMSAGYSGLPDVSCVSSESDCVLSWDPDSSFSDWSTPLKPDWPSPEFDCFVPSDQNQVTSESDCLTDSTSHSLSPISSVDSYRLSPPYLPCASGQEAYGSPCENVGRPAPSEGRLGSGQRARKARSRYPGRQRQSASEREKLRMRGLAKALHNLRTYLPPSVAPASQSLTKLETLRLTIRYIAHLTELLGLSEEGPAEGRDTEGRCQGCPRGPACCQAWLPHPALLPPFPSAALPYSLQGEPLTTATPDRHTPSQDFNCETESIQGQRFPQNYAPGF